MPLGWMPSLYMCCGGGFDPPRRRGERCHCPGAAGGGLTLIATSRQQGAESRAAELLCLAPLAPARCCGSSACLAAVRHRQLRRCSPYCCKRPACSAGGLHPAEQLLCAGQWWPAAPDGPHTPLVVRCGRFKSAVTRVVLGSIPVTYRQPQQPTSCNFQSPGLSRPSAVMLCNARSGLSGRLF